MLRVQFLRVESHHRRVQRGVQPHHHLLHRLHLHLQSSAERLILYEPNFSIYPSCSGGHDEEYCEQDCGGHGVPGVHHRRAKQPPDPSDHHIGTTPSLNVTSIIINRPDLTNMPSMYTTIIAQCVIYNLLQKTGLVCSLVSLSFCPNNKKCSKLAKL